MGRRRAGAEAGEAPEELRGGHAPVRRRAAVAEVTHEEGEHRPEAHLGPELAARDLAEVGEELDEAMALLAAQLVDSRGQMIGSHIGEIGKGEGVGHASLYSTFRAPRRTLPVAPDAAFPMGASRLPVGSARRAPRTRSGATSAGGVDARAWPRDSRK
jgi:hypothetical protein